MADISSQIDKIRRSERGEDVRDAITSALQTINNDSPQPDPTSIVIDMPVGQDYHITGGPWDEITVHQAGSGGKTTELKELKVTDNNTEWPKDDEDYDPDENILYYSKVKVEVPQLANDVLMDPVEITQNGEYSATEWGVDGLRSINVNVQGSTGDGPFKVEFYDITKSTVIQTVIDVPKGGKASCTVYDGTVHNGQYFTGWNPSPTNVTRDMKCYPMFGDVIIDPNEIQDSWETICAKKGAGYPLGSYRSLVVNVPTRPQRDAYRWDTVDDGDYYSGADVTNASLAIAMHMVKVAEGEDGTTSTWLSTGVIPVFPTWDSGAGGLARPFDNSISIRSCVCGYVHKPKGDSAVKGDVWVDWIDSPRREYLNDYLIENLPECLGAAIKPVNKVSASLNLLPYFDSYPSSSTQLFKPSIDKIWVPSYKELWSYMQSKGYHSNFDHGAEPTGIDYTAVYMPTYPAGSTLTRSAIKEVHNWGITNVYISGTNELTSDIDSFVGSPIGFCL